MNAYEIKKMADECSINASAAIKMRIRYLQRELNKALDWEESEDQDSFPELFTDEIIDELKKLSHALNQLSKPIKTDSITDAMIEQARQYPIESLIEFTKGKARAFCHDDSSPSLSLWNGKNLCRCFPCGKTYNPIDVLIERDGMTFLSAVRYLCSK
jgi:hypothetical protein